MLDWCVRQVKESKDRIRARTAGDEVNNHTQKNPQKH
jgi:hypothetical protein